MPRVWLPTGANAGTLGHALVYGALGSWFLATVLSQDPTRKHPGFRAVDPLGLVIADWRFFAPKPGMEDNHLLYRDELADGTLTPWREVAQDRTRRPLQMLFYPTRRGDKAITDAVGMMLLVARTRTADDNLDAIQLTIPYIALLNFITNQQPHETSAVKTEFVLATSQGFDETSEPEVVFLSNRHPLVGRRSVETSAGAAWPY